METVAHTLTEYLPRTSTFVYTLLRFQQRYQPVVLSRRVTNLAEFPLDGVIHALDDGESPLGRLNHRFPILPVSIRDPYVRRVEAKAREHACVLLHAHFGWSGVVSV